MSFQIGSSLLDACVLSVLAKGDTYGYVLTQTMARSKQRTLVLAGGVAANSKLRGMKMLEDYEILEVCRTGVTGILRGWKTAPEITDL